MSIEEKTIKNSLFGVNLKLFFRDSEPYFIGGEVARKLGFKEPDSALRNHVKDSHKMSVKEFLSSVPKSERPSSLLKLHPKTFMLDEFAFYALCLKSTLPEIEPFQEWVYSIIRDIRKGVISTSEKLSQDNPVKLIRQLIPQIPKYRDEGDNSLRRALCKVLKEAYNEAKNPYQVKAGRKGGKETQKRIREMKETLEKLKDKIEKSIEKVEIELERSLEKISSSSSSSNSSDSEEE